MTTITIGSGAFDFSGAAYGHNAPPAVSVLMKPRAVQDAAIRVPLRFGMGRWDCTRLANLPEAERMHAMQAFARTARTTHWLRHDVSVRGDAETTLSDAASTELWRRIEEYTGLSRAQIGDWAATAFGKPRHHADLVPWLGQLMPHYSFTLHMGLVPLMIALRPDDARFPEGVTLMLNVLVDGMYHVDVTDQCAAPPQPIRQALPLRGLAGTTDNAKRWSINVARLTAQNDPKLSRLLGMLRRL